MRFARCFSEQVAGGRGAVRPTGRPEGAGPPYDRSVHPSACQGIAVNQITVLVGAYVSGDTLASTRRRDP